MTSPVLRVLKKRQIESDTGIRCEDIHSTLASHFSRTFSPHTNHNHSRSGVTVTPAESHWAFPEGVQTFKNLMNSSVQKANRSIFQNLPRETFFSPETSRDNEMESKTSDVEIPSFGTLPELGSQEVPKRMHHPLDSVDRTGVV